VYPSQKQKKDGKFKVTQKNPGTENKEKMCFDPQREHKKSARRGVKGDGHG